jgi:DNA-binding transcriptional ArsR family regulator
MSPTQAKSQPVIDPRMMKALSHPIRQQILVILNREVASPNQIAQEIGESLGTVSYHVKTLVELDGVELVRTRPVRGALEHFYRATMRPEIDDDHWSRMPLSARQKLLDQALQYIWTDIAEAAAGDGFDDDRTHVSRTPLELDEQGYDEMVELATELMERAMAVSAESVNRLAKLPEEQRETRSTELVLLHFHRPAKR